MKWYTFGGNNNSDKVNLLLDHNTTAKVAWNSAGTNTEMREAKIALENDTTGWIGSPRLITADEIAAITGNTSFNSATATKSNWFYFDTNTTTPATNRGPGTSEYAWLFDRTNGCTNQGCDIADSLTDGYWVGTALAGSGYDVWTVGYNGDLQKDIAKHDNIRGVRPVITISKSDLS